MANRSNKPDEMDDTMPRGGADDTEGFGVDPTNVRAEQSAAAQDKPKKVAVDPVTNQPISDFMPTLPADHPDADAVRVQNERIKVGSIMGRQGAAQQLIEAREAQRQQAEMNKASYETTMANNKLPEAEMTILPPDVYRARMQAQVMAEAAVLGTSTIVPGGRFLVNGQWVNANGEAVEGAKE